MDSAVESNRLKVSNVLRSAYRDRLESIVEQRLRRIESGATSLPEVGGQLGKYSELGLGSERIKRRGAWRSSLMVFCAIRS